MMSDTRSVHALRKWTEPTSLRRLVLVATVLASVSAVGANARPSDATAAAPTLDGKVVAYRYANGFGPQQTFGPGAYLGNLGQLSSVGNDLILRLDVGPSMRVRACANEAPLRNTCTNYENLTTGNRTFRVKPGTSRLEVRPLVVGYRDPYGTGVAQGFEIGRHESAKGDLAKVGNDQITSLRMAPGLTARLCSDNPETTVGYTCLVFGGPTWAIPASLDNRASWIEIRPVTVAYQNAQFAGVSQRFGPGIYSASQMTTVGNNTISSLLVNEGVSTRICDTAALVGGGACGLYKNSALALPSSLDNQTSWISSRHNVILQPLTDVALGDETVTLRGYAVDPEDGELRGSQLRWYSSRDGFLGSGNVITVHLSLEDCFPEHVISLISFDRQGTQMRTDRVYRINKLC
jgi:hypothetical protein